MGESLKELVLRPNLKNNGTIPKFSDNMESCPDIWLAGDDPVGDFQNTLADKEYYEKSSADDYVYGHLNYVYIRIKNNSTKALIDVFADLFYCDAEHISSVSNWIRVPVENQNANPGGCKFNTEIKQGEVAVVSAPFILPSNLIPGKKYYLIARIWSDDERYKNPMPSRLRPIYIDELLSEHLLWGQRTFYVKPQNETDCTFFYSSTAFSPSKKLFSNKDIDEFDLGLETKNLKNKDIRVEIHNSRTDNNDNKIFLNMQTIDDDIKHIGYFKLKKGYSSQMTIYVYRGKDYLPSADEFYQVSVWKKDSNKDNIEHNSLTNKEVFTFNTI